MLKIAEMSANAPPVRLFGLAGPATQAINRDVGNAMYGDNALTEAIGAAGVRRPAFQPEQKVRQVPVGTQISDVWDDIHRVRHASKRISDHPCQLPVHLIERLILMTTDAGDLVVDPFCGGGSAAVAARQMGRCYIGAEIDAVYQKQAQQKYDDAKPTKIGDAYVSMHLGKIVSVRDCDVQEAALCQSQPNLPLTKCEEGTQVFPNFPQVECEERLKLLVAAGAGSMEVLDRVCMVSCPEQPSWSQRRQSASATRAIAEFLLNPDGVPAVPQYVRERLRLTVDFLNRIQSNIVHSSLQSLYNTHSRFAVENVINGIVQQAGYTCEKRQVALVDNKEVDAVVPGLTLPRILIMALYQLTTASSQSQRARTADDV